MTILDYVVESPKVLKEIINNQDRIFNDAIEYLSGKDIQEIYILGSGTSCFAGISAKQFIEEFTGIRVTPLFPLSFIEQESIINKNSLVLGLSQSGTSLSTINGLKKARELNLYTIAMSGVANSEIEKHADCVIPLACGIEKAVAKTKGYTASVLTFYLFAMKIAQLLNKKSTQKIDCYLKQLIDTIDNIPVLIDETTKWYQTVKEELVCSKRMILIGYNNQYGNMLEATLKFVETVRIGVSGYELEEFMHGIYNSITHDTFILTIGSKDKYLPRARQLKSYLKNITEHQFIFTNQEDIIDSKDCVLSFKNYEYFNVLETIIPFQCLCYLLPNDLGINPNLPSDPNFHRNMNSKLV